MITGGHPSARPVCIRARRRSAEPSGTLTVNPTVQNRPQRRTSWDAGYCFGSSAFHCRSFFWSGCLAAYTADIAKADIAKW